MSDAGSTPADATGKRLIVDQLLVRVGQRQHEVPDGERAGHHLGAGLWDDFGMTTAAGYL